MSNDQRLYLVARPPDLWEKVISPWQYHLAQRYELYDGPLPPLHITLKVIEISDQTLLDTAIEALEVAAGATKPFDLHIQGHSCFPPPYKSINLRVQQTPELLAFDQRLEEALIQAQVPIFNPFDQWEYHLSLVNTAFASREWTEQEYVQACQWVAENPLELIWSVKRVELWYPEYDPHLKVASTFILGRQELPGMGEN